uniref:Actin-related protein 2/3 complex subunit 3 n=1 Tax=Bicosoecida sp. CB-2014 TaxID=1486930 RepID=A0A7S1CH91_9STRA|mmetsp:Transcript_25124/g.87655  ORF Transcript_25124/g.87655 Transcript_25124/m.87655 type:complete len:188 (+) Transcript_25124:181-744(+)
MPVYHSAHNEAPGVREACGCAILPLTTTARGPAPPRAPPAGAAGAAGGDDASMDIVDEAIVYFRANVFFKNFEIKGPADRVLVYLTLFTHYCLTRAAPIKTEAEGRRELARVAIAKPSIPGEPGFPLSGMFSEPANGEEAEMLRSYLKQCRETLVSRLVDRIYHDGAPDKFWLAFSKRKFMNKTLNG